MATRARRWLWLMAAVVLAVAVAAWWVAADGNWPARREVAQASGHSLTLRFHVGYGANLFYVVDQISRWDPHTRTYYQAYWKKRFGATPEDLRVLGNYCRLRAQYPWGQLEPAFYGPGDARDARERLAKIAPRDDARGIGNALEQFRPEFDRIWGEAGYLEQMTKDLAAGIGDEHTRLFDEAARLFGASRLTIDVLAIWSPEPLAGGGGFNGGRIALEMPRGRPIERVTPVLFHEALHAVQEPKEAELEAFAKEKGIPPGVMHEVIMYAIAPGVFARRSQAVDPLPGQIAEMERQDVSPEDELYQTRKLARALETVTDECLRSGTTLPQYLEVVAAARETLLRTDAYLAQLTELERCPGGTGMVLEPQAGRLVVTGFDPGAPAQAAGIRIGDEIVEVRGRTLEEWQRRGASPRKVGWRELRGEVGDSVELGVMRGEQRLPFRVSLALVAALAEPPSEPQALALCRREVAEALNERLQLYLDAFGPEFIGDKLEAIPRKPFIIAISPDEISIPSKFHYLVPMDYDELMARLRRGETVTMEQERDGGPVVLLAAPKRGRLLQLIREYDFSKLLAAVYAPPAAERGPAEPKEPSRSERRGLAPLATPAFAVAR